MNNVQSLVNYITSLKLVDDDSTIVHCPSTDITWDFEIQIYALSYKPSRIRNFITDETNIHPDIIRFAQMWCAIVLNCQPHSILVSMMDNARMYDKFDLIVVTANGKHACLTSYKRLLRKFLTPEMVKMLEYWHTL